MKTKLTEVVVAKAKPKENGGQALYWDTELKGFGLLCSATAKSFVIQRRNVRKTVGRYPELSVAAARHRGQQRLIEMEDAHRNPKPKALELTLQQALDRYLGGMRQRKCSERSVLHLEHTIKRYLSDWLTRRLQDIDRAEVQDRHTKVGEANGKFAANAAMRALRAVWNDAMLVDQTLGVSPTLVLKRRWFKERRRQEPIADLAAWAKRVEDIDNPTRRNLQWFTLLTGLRSLDARSIRWADIDFEKGTLHRPKPKGGEERAFTIPLSGKALEILQNQRSVVRVVHPKSPWVWPATDKKGKLTHVREFKIQDRWVKGQDGKKLLRPGLPSPHRLRDTYTTLCVEAGLSPFDVDVLTNHRPPKGTVTAGYVRQSLEHLRKCQEQVTALIITHSTGRSGSTISPAGLHA